MSKFDELKKLADAATPGIWTAEPPAEDYERDGGEQYHWSVRAPYPTPPTISYQLCRLSSLNNNEEEDAQFIAAANPAAVLELLTILAQLVAVLSKSKRYVSGAYECAFPDEEENAQVLIDIDAAIAATGAQP